MMAFYKLLFTIITTCAAVTRCEDCIFNVKHGENYFQFDLNRLKDMTTTGFNIKLCNSNDQKATCAGVKSKVCLVQKNENLQFDIGSKIKELKLDDKNQLVMSLEGSTSCEKNRNYTTDITFVCSRDAFEDNFIVKSSFDRCKYITELTSVVACPVYDLDIRKVCSDIAIPHSNYKFNLSPLRRLTNNYLVENQNRRFEMNICGRLNNNTCGGNITTICDVSDVMNPKVYAVGSKNDKLVYDTDSRNVKLIQYERASKNKRGKRIEIVFKCNESISVKDTKPEFVFEDNYLSKANNIAHFEVATSIVCIPRIKSCEVFTNNARFNLNPLHSRFGNWIVPNEKDGGKFHLNVCGYLNQFKEKIPASCSDGKTSVCYEYSPGKGISIGSTQIGPYNAGNSLILNYTDGEYCKNSLKWSTVIKFTCSEEPQFHHSKNLNLCIHAFQWESREACEVLFERKSQCMVTHPKYSNIVFNMSYLKDQSFETNDYVNNEKFLFSICGPLQTPCNGNLDSAVCWYFNGIEKNIGLSSEEIVFENNKIYLSMEGEKCNNNGPNSSTVIRFLCDYSDSKTVDFKKDLQKCTFEFFIFTKHACTPPTKVNCSVNDESGNFFDLSKLTKLTKNYEIKINQKKKIIFNICHSVINNDKDEIGCQFNSSVCLVDRSQVLTSSWYKNLGDVNKSLSKKGSKILLEMSNGFYKNHVVSSVIEFVCSNISSKTNSPEFISEENHKFTFKFYTSLVCPSVRQKREMTQNYKTDTTSLHFEQIDGSNYSIYICPKIYEADNYCNLIESDLNGVESSQLAVILTVNGEKTKNYLNMRSNFFYDTHTICSHNETKRINFNFICGIESKTLKMKKTKCISNVLIIDPEVCDQKLECKVKSYDLTPIKGSYVVINEGVKYFINLCKVGEEGAGGLVELNGKNYSMGFQVSPPTSIVRDTVEISYKYGDDCYLEENSYPLKYFTTIRFICDVTEAKGKPVFVETWNKCVLEFEWKTSLLCSKKSIEFDMPSCVATLVDNQKDFDSPKMINMTNILSINEFFDNATNIMYNIHFCNDYVITSNSSNVFGNMSLQYDDYKKQMIAGFKNDGSKSMKIIITCSNFTEKFPVFEITSDIETTINTYSEGVCCFDDIHNTNEICKNYLLTPIITSTFKTTTTFEDKLVTDFQNDEPNENLEYLENELEKPITLITEQNKKSHVYILDNNINLPPNDERKIVFDNNTKIQEMEKNVSSTSFDYSGLIMLVLVLVLTLFIWIYRLKLIKELRKLLNYSPFMVTRRRRIFH